MWVPLGTGPGVMLAAGVCEPVGADELLPLPPPPDVTAQITSAAISATSANTTTRRRQ
jgi:hypothetical protein